MAAQSALTRAFWSAGLPCEHKAQRGLRLLKTEGQIPGRGNVLKHFCKPVGLCHFTPGKGVDLGGALTA